MPLVDTDEVAPALLNPLGSNPLPETEESGPSPGWGVTLGAAFRTENLIGSYATQQQAQQGSNNLPVPGYEVWADIKGTKYEDYWSSFLDANNPERVAAIKRQIDQEEDDRRTLAAAGWRGTIAALAASAADPTVLIPVGGELSLGSKGIWNIGRGAAAGARGAGIGTAAQELGLHETQEIRTPEESAMAIGGSIVLGGILGGGAAGLLSRPEQLAAEEALERLHEMPRAADSAQPESVGAAATSRPTRDDLTVSGRVAEKVASTTRMIAPNMRANFRAAPSARQFSQELAENTLYQTMHDEGRTLGAAVETEARMIYRARLAEAIQAHNDIFGEMKKSGTNMSRQDFEEAIGRAMRRDDTGDNDFVSRAARSWRERVFDPWKNEAIEQGLLPADVSVQTADSYFSRLWNRQRLNAQEPVFKEKVTAYYEGMIAGDYAQSVEAFQRLMKRYRDHEADLQLTPKQRTKLIAEIEAKGEALDADNAFHIDRLGEVNDLRQQAKKATSEGRFTDADVLKLEARKRYDEGGEPLKQYVAERRKLRQRRDRLKGPADKAARDVRLRKVAEKRAAAERLFYDRWEIKRLGEGVNPHDPTIKPNFKSHARDIADEVFDKLTGRDAGNSASVAPEHLVPLTRGPMKDRTFNIPDQLIEEFLEDNVISIGERYGRTMAADIELTKRFGRADMRDQIQTIRDEYRQLREAATSEADRKALADDEKGAVHDLEAMRDLIRGTYKAVENASNYGRLVRSLMAFNYLRQMGGVVIANIAELYRPAMVHGLGRYLNQGIRPLLTNINAIKLSVKEAKLAGQVTERVLQNRMMGLGEIGDPYRSGTAVERWLTNGSRFGSKWNGLVYWTDGMKAISSVLSQNRLLEAAAKGKDKRLLAYLGIDEDLARRINKQFVEHGDTEDGVRIANTQHWTDDEAVRAYRAAVSKDVDSIIVTRSVGDVPLFANTPTGRLILQFRNYTFAAHQRVTLRALQEGKAQFVSGLIGITTLGMMGAVLRSWRAGEDRWERFKDAANNPGYLIGEGLDLGGAWALPIEISNDIEKLTGPTGFSFNPIKSPLKASGRVVNPEASLSGQSVRFASRDPIGAILGPSAGLPSTVAQAAGAGGALSTGGEATQGQASAATSLVPFGSYVGMKEAIQVVSGDSPYVEETAQ